MPDRRDFIGSIAATGMLAALPASALADVLNAPINLTRAERDAAANAADEAWDLTWVDRLRGKSRAVFDSPRVSEGGALFRAILWRDQYAKVFGGTKSDVTPVVVFRHEAIPLIMDDAHWEHIGVGKDLQMKDSKGKWAKKNPFSTAAPDAPASMKEYTLPAFIADGGIALACNLAFAQIIEQYKEKDKVSRDDAIKAAKAHIIPGVILQPSGFFAVLKAQDEGCKYMMGS
jgi:hypothetical protein